LDFLPENNGKSFIQHQSNTMKLSNHGGKRYGKMSKVRINGFIAKEEVDNGWST
jgi:hypothetical protein